MKSFKILLGSTVAGIAAIAIVVVFGMSVIGFHGCASMSVPEGSPPEVVNAALCKDAQLGFAIVSIALQKPNMSEAEKVYWDKYNEGVRLAVTNYCMKP